MYAESENLFAIADGVVVGCSLALVEAEYFGSVYHFLRLLHGKGLLSGIAIHTCEHSLDSIHVHTELAVAEECGTVVLIGEEVACVVSFEQLLGSLQVVYNLSHNLIGRQHRSGVGVERCLVGDGGIGRMLAVDGAVEAQQVEVEEGAQTQCFALYHLVIVGRCEHVAMTLQSGQQIVDVGNDVVLCLVDAVALVEEEVVVVENRRLIEHVRIVAFGIVAVQARHFVKIGVGEVAGVEAGGAHSEIDAGENILETRLRLEHLVGWNILLWRYVKPVVARRQASRQHGYYQYIYVFHNYCVLDCD